MKTQTYITLNNSNHNANDETITALCHKLPTNMQAKQLWLPMINLNNMQGKDGRSWTVDDPQQVIANTDLPFQLDIDHASELTTNTVASGWFEELKVKNNQILARLELNSMGQQAINDKQYKFYSPAFVVAKGSNKIIKIKSVGLTNQPNLDVPALNNEGNKSTQTNQEQPMEQLLALLGLSKDASEEVAINAVKALQDKANQQIDLNAYVPTATHEQTVVALNAVQAELAEIKTAKHNEAVEVAINKAIANKKIAPADKEFYTSCCASGEGLADFNKFIDSKAPIIGESNLPNADKAPNASETALNSEQKGLLGQLGLSAEDLKEVKDDK